VAQRAPLRGTQEEETGTVVFEDGMGRCDSSVWHRTAVECIVPRTTRQVAPILRAHPHPQPCRAGTMSTTALSTRYRVNLGWGSGRA
jgi:hypothetical protein